MMYVVTMVAVVQTPSPIGRKLSPSVNQNPIMHLCRNCLVNSAHKHLGSCKSLIKTPGSYLDSCNSHKIPTTHLEVKASPGQVRRFSPAHLEVMTSLGKNHESVTPTPKLTCAAETGSRSFARIKTTPADPDRSSAAPSGGKYWNCSRQILNICIWPNTPASQARGAAAAGYGGTAEEECLKTVTKTQLYFSREILPKSPEGSFVKVARDNILSEKSPEFPNKDDLAALKAMFMIRGRLYRARRVGPEGAHAEESATFGRLKILLCETWKVKLSPR
ncbi:hypothetical protein Bbelb_095740 [Branchiostoma belcheri]|nr:hypothetical protein Bbelb_095740 [Branchiostoma belcheri]